MKAVTVLFMRVFSKARFVCSQVTVLFMVVMAPWPFEMISFYGAVESRDEIFPPVDGLLQDCGNSNALIL